MCMRCPDALSAERCVGMASARTVSAISIGIPRKMTSSTAQRGAKKHHTVLADDVMQP